MGERKRFDMYLLWHFFLLFDQENHIFILPQPQEFYTRRHSGCGAAGDECDVVRMSVGWVWDMLLLTTGLESLRRGPQQSPT